MSSMDFLLERRISFCCAVFYRSHTHTHTHSPVVPVTDDLNKSDIPIKWAIISTRKTLASSNLQTGFGNDHLPAIAENH